MSLAAQREVVRGRPRGAHRAVSLPNDFILRPYQLAAWQYLQDPSIEEKRAVLVWPRREGKDLVLINNSACRSMERVGAYWHCLPTYSQAKLSVWDAWTMDVEHPKPVVATAFPEAMVAQRNESELQLELVNGSRWRLVGSDNMNRLVGSGPVGMNFSEYALAKPMAWDLAKPILRQNGGWACFAYTPRGRNHGWELLETAKREGWFWQHLTIEDIHGPEEAERIVEWARRQGMPDALIRQEFFCDFAAANAGAIFADLVDALERHGAIGAFDHPYDGTYTTWDLGHSDSTAIWFWRLRGSGVEVIDYYENNGQPLSHYLNVVDSRPYGYVRHWLPHDARAKTLVTGGSVQETALAHWGPARVGIVPFMSIADGIEAGRWLLQQQGTRFKSTLGHSGLAALRDYHYAWDEDARVYSKKPIHSWSSHGADAWRYTGLVVRAEARAAHREEPKEFAIGGVNRRFHLEDLYETVGPRRGGRI